MAGGEHGFSPVTGPEQLAGKGKEEKSKALPFSRGSLGPALQAWAGAPVEFPCHSNSLARGRQLSGQAGGGRVIPALKDTVLAEH